MVTRIIDHMLRRLLGLLILDYCGDFTGVTLRIITDSELTERIELVEYLLGPCSSDITKSRTRFGS